MVASFVLGRDPRCDVPQRVRLTCVTLCGLAGWPFWAALR